MWNKLWVSGAMCVFVAAEVGAQNAHSVALDRCQSAATTTVRKARPQTDSVKYSTNPQVSRTSDLETEVLDVGEYLDKKVGDWHVFAYNCLFNSQSESANVSVTWTASDHDDKPVGRRAPVSRAHADPK